MIRAAGIVFLTLAGKALWLKRSGLGDHAGEWCFPGGKIEAGETAEQAATREAEEEISYLPPGARTLLHHSISAEGVDFTTFLQRVDGEFAVVLDGEHTAWAWAGVEEPPQPVHPAVAKMLGEARADIDATMAKKQRAGDAMRGRFYTVESLSAKRHLTPEGFLICEDVPLARIGEQIYGPGETPIRPNRQGFARVLREPGEVFRPETIASAQGKPYVVDHPDTNEVTPRTFSQLAKGVILNARRGTGPDADVMLGDLQIMDHEEIQELLAIFDRGERPEVSMGYDCGYEEEGEPGSGLGRQFDILINHVARVDQGRCGPRCAIGDVAKKGIKTMATKDNSLRGAIDRLRKAFRSKDEKKIEETIDDCEEMAKDAERDDEEAEKKKAEDAKRKSGDAANEEMTKRVDSIEKKMEDGFKKIGDAIAEMKEKKNDTYDSESEANKKILGELEMEAPPGAVDKAVNAKDSAFLEESYHRTVADVEIIAPGLRVPTFDRAAQPVKSFDAICGTRRRALDVAMLQPEVKTFVDNVAGGRAFDSKTATCDAARVMFNAVVQMKRQMNNGSSVSSRVADLAKGVAGPMTIAELNKANAARRGEKVA